MPIISWDFLNVEGATDAAFDPAKSAGLGCYRELLHPKPVKVVNIL